jgi:hypothetical protein
MADLGLDGDCVARANFPLPNLGPRLRACADELHNGRGFFVLRGLDPDRYTPEDNVLMFLGLSGHVADLRGCQDKAGNMLSESGRASRQIDSDTDLQLTSRSTHRPRCHAASVGWWKPTHRW